LSDSAFIESFKKNLCRHYHVTKI